MITWTRLLECNGYAQMLIKLLVQLVSMWPLSNDYETKSLWNTGSVKDRSGQPWKSSAQDDSSIPLRVFWKYKITARKLQQDLQRNVRLLIDAIHRCIKAAGLKSYQPYKWLVLTPAHRWTCLTWATHYLRHTLLASRAISQESITEIRLLLYMCIPL